MALKNNLIVTAKVSSKNRITIPKQIRNKLNIHAHDEVAFEIYEDGSIVLKKEPDEFWNLVAEQSVKYKTLDDAELDWGIDVGEEVID